MGLVSKKCVDFVKSFEGFSPTPYLDTLGVKTLGYGMTGNIIAGLTRITEAQASQMLENLLNNNYAAPIKDNLAIRKVILNQNQFDSLVSMAYNIGVVALLSSTLYKNIVDGIRDKATITLNFQAWSNAGGKRLEGLYRRRTAEAEMFFRNDNILAATTIVKEEKQVENLVVVNISGQVDFYMARKLAATLKCPIIDSEVRYDYTNIKNVYCVGAPKTLGFTSYATKIMTGKDRYETVRMVNPIIIANGGTAIQDSEIANL